MFDVARPTLPLEIVVWALLDLMRQRDPHLLPALLKRLEGTRPQLALAPPEALSLFDNHVDAIRALARQRPPAP